MLEAHFTPGYLQFCQSGSWKGQSGTAGGSLTVTACGNGVWQAPLSVTSVRVKLIGGGAASGGGDGGFGGGGGGGGGYSSFTMTVTPLTFYSYTVGCGGALTWSGGVGGAGGDTVFNGNYARGGISGSGVFNGGVGGLGGAGLTANGYSGTNGAGAGGSCGSPTALIDCHGASGPSPQNVAQWGGGGACAGDGSVQMGSSGLLYFSW